MVCNSGKMVGSEYSLLDRGEDLLICVIFFLYIPDTFAGDSFRIHQDSGQLIEIVSSLLTI